MVRFRSRQIGSLDESSRLPRQSPWRRYCCVGSPGPTAVASRWGPPPSPPVVEPRSSTPRLPLPLYETDDCPLFPFRFPFPPSLATAEWVVMLFFFVGLTVPDDCRRTWRRARKPVRKLVSYLLPFWIYSDLGFVGVWFDQNLHASAYEISSIWRVVVWVEDDVCSWIPHCFLIWSIRIFGESSGVGTYKQ